MLILHLYDASVSPAPSIYCLLVAPFLFFGLVLAVFRQDALWVFVEIIAATDSIDRRCGRRGIQLRNVG